MSGLFAFVKGIFIALGWMHDERLKQEGIELQKGEEAKTAARVETAIAKAEAEGPKTDAELQDRLDSKEPI